MVIAVHEGYGDTDLRRSVLRCLQIHVTMFFWRYEGRKVSNLQKKVFRNTRTFFTGSFFYIIVNPIKFRLSLRQGRT